jgi:hypothetical protein
MSSTILRHNAYYGTYALAIAIHDQAKNSWNLNEPHVQSHSTHIGPSSHIVRSFCVSMHDCRYNIKFASKVVSISKE